MIFIIFNFTPKDEHNFIIADLKTPDQKEQPNKLYSTKFTGDDSLTELLLKAQELKAEGYIIMVGEYQRVKSFDEPFDILKHFDILNKDIQELQETAKELPLKDDLDALGEKYKIHFNLEKIYFSLVELLKKHMPIMADLPERIKPSTEIEFLDIAIEIARLLYCKLYKLNYEEEKINNLLVREPLMDILLRYKIDNYGDEIMRKFGFKITDRREDGSIKIEELTPEEMEVNKILN